MNAPITYSVDIVYIEDTDYDSVLKVDRSSSRHYDINYLYRTLLSVCIYLHCKHGIIR